MTCFPSYAILPVSLAIPYQLILGYSAFFGKHIKFDQNFFLGFVALWLLFQLFYCTICALSRISLRLQQSQINKAFVSAGIPIILIPASIPLYKEIQFILVKKLAFIPPRNISAVIILILLLSSLTFFAKSLRSIKSVSLSSRPISRIYYPIIIATDVIFICHRHFLSFPRFDMFHTGEAAVPTQQLFQYGSLPFVDFFPPHGLFDFFPQILYRFLNGDRALEMLLWGN